MCAGLYVASPVEDYLLLIHVAQSEGGGQGLSEGEQNMAQLITRVLLPLLTSLAACLLRILHACETTHAQQLESGNPCPVSLAQQHHLAWKALAQPSSGVLATACKQ